MKKYSLILVATLGLTSQVHAEIWEWGCESAIRSLQEAQEDVASAKEDIDSAKSTYNLCTPSRYSSCELERSRLNRAIDDYNSAIRDFEYALTSFNFSCLN